MAVDPIGGMTLMSALHQISGRLIHAAGDAPDAGLAIARLAVPGLNDAIVWPKTHRELFWAATANRGSRLSYNNKLMDPHSLFRLLHQQRFAMEDGLGGPSANAWQWLRNMLRYHGIDMAMPDDAGAPEEAKAWLQLAQYTASVGPLGSFVEQYWRLKGTPQEARARSELDRAMRFGAHSGPADRQIIVAPPHSWSLPDIQRMRRFQIIGRDEWVRMINQAGYRTKADEDLAKLIDRVLPAPHELIHWQARDLWNAELADKYGLSEGNDGTQHAAFWSSAQGFGYDEDPLPNVPPGSPDWYTLAARAAKSIPGFGEAREMQWRLRPSATNPVLSMVPGAPIWKRENTIDVLKMHGYSEKTIEWLMGLMVQPLTFRIANHILIPSLRDPAILAESERVFGQGVDWLQNMFLDHGHPVDRAKLLANGMREQGDRSANAEKWDERRKIRSGRRDVVRKGFSAGTYTYEQAVSGLQDQYFDAEMARNDVANLQDEIALGIITRQIKSVHDGYMKGSLSLANVQSALTALTITPLRTSQYVTEWTWERTEEMRTLSTGEIIGLMKDGMITPAVAQQRLANLGWRNGDALLVIAKAEREIIASQAKVLASAQAKSAAEMAKQLKAQQAEAHRSAVESARAQAQGKKQELVDALALHKELLAGDRYYGLIHANNKAYHDAVAKGDVEKANAAVSHELGAYQQYLIDHIRIATEVSPDVQAQVIAEAVPGGPTDRGALTVDSAVPSTGAGDKPTK